MMEQSGLATRSCSGELHDILPGDERRSSTIKYFLRFTIYFSFFMKVTKMCTYAIVSPVFHPA